MGTASLGSMDVDTIVALSTPAGVGAIAVVRVSGPAASTVLGALIGQGELPVVRAPALMELRDPEDGSVIDRAVVTRFEAPASYTGEDMVELSCHGGRLVPGLVVHACRRAGARPAEPGEFTRRAYLRGKLDLVQAEAIADLIDAGSRALHRAAVHQLDRGLSARVSGMRQRLVRVEALLAHHVDFPEEDDAPVPVGAVLAEADGLLEELDAMLATAPEGQLLREGALAVLAGRPNAGKSSLYNALIGEERAIVTEVPGTTRDALETQIQMGGFPFRLVDTAGLRGSPERIERMGIEVARRYMDGADVILYCVPADEGPTEDDMAFVREVVRSPVVWIDTKADRRSEAGLPSGGGVAPGAPSAGRTRLSAREVAAVAEGVVGRVRVSAETGEGLGELRRLLPELVYSAVVSAGSEQPVLTRKRHQDALQVAREEIAAFRTGLSDGLPAEVAGTHLRTAETALEELLGTVSVDDVLDVVFREFCIGK